MPLLCSDASQRARESTYKTLMFAGQEEQFANDRRLVNLNCFCFFFVFQNPVRFE